MPPRHHLRSIPAALGILTLSAAMTPSNAPAQGCPAATFAAPVLYTLPAAGKVIVAGDMNGDTRPDLVTCYGSTTTSNVGVFLNSGTGTFGAVMPRSVAGTPLTVAVADVNRDNNLDVILTYNGTGLTSTVGILLGNGTGALAAAVTYTVTGTIRHAIAADFNGDQWPDLAVATGTTSGVAILLNNGNGTFGSPVAYGGSINATWLVAADLNHDSQIDLAVAIASGTVAILPGIGDGTFGALATAAAAQDQMIALADLNSDNNLDFVVGTSGPSSALTVLMGNGMGGLGPANTYPGVLSPTFAATDDFNGDGKPDVIVVALPGANAYYYQGNGSGTLAAGTTIASLNNNFKVAVADFNADGRPDFAVTSSNVASMAVMINASTCNVACCRGSACVAVLYAACVAPDVIGAIGGACNAPMNNVMPCCKADFNHAGAVTVQDIFDFLAGWFNGSPSADIDGGGITVADIFEFLMAWFAGC